MGESGAIRSADLGIARPVTREESRGWQIDQQTP
jgi:hypothetical protein